MPNIGDESVVRRRRGINEKNTSNYLVGKSERKTCFISENAEPSILWYKVNLNHR